MTTLFVLGAFLIGALLCAWAGVRLIRRAMTEAEDQYYADDYSVNAPTPEQEL